MLNLIYGRMCQLLAERNPDFRVNAYTSQTTGYVSQNLLLGHPFSYDNQRQC
jgi:hypothetical protein